MTGSSPSGKAAVLAAANELVSFLRASVVAEDEDNWGPLDTWTAVHASAFSVNASVQVRGLSSAQKAELRAELLKMADRVTTDVRNYLITQKAGGASVATYLLHELQEATGRTFLDLLNDLQARLTGGDNWQ
jgi:hypothetical protein